MLFWLQMHVRKLVQWQVHLPKKNTFDRMKSLPQRGCGKSKDVNRQLHLLTGNHLPKKKVLNYIIHLTFALV